MKTILIRSPLQLVKEGMVGYGYKTINFSAFKDEKSLLDEFKNQNKDLGRRKSKIKRFFNIKKRDRIVVPLNKSIAIGYAEGKKSYDLDTKLKDTQNRQHVTFLSEINSNNLALIPRDVLETKLQQRLRVPQTCIDLCDFNKQFDLIEKRLKNDQSLQPLIINAEKIENYIAKFKKNLINRLQKNKGITLKAGGQGLEYLVKELLEIEGYDKVKILPKKSIKSEGDIDISGEKVDFSGIKEFVFCQIKHHKSFTAKKAINQLIEANKSQKKFHGCYTKYIAITTAEFKEDILNYAYDNNIICMGKNLVANWIVDNISELKQETLANLGVGIVPCFLDLIAQP